MSYTINLAKPGDFYEFTIDVENKGTFDADLAAITLSTLTEAQKKYLTYSLSYDGTTYNATQASITGVTLPKATGTANVKVRVEYIAPTSEADLPTANEEIELTATLSYKQSA